MSEKTLRALSLVAGYSAVMEDDYSSPADPAAAADLCDLGRETMDWIIENSNHLNLVHFDIESNTCGGSGEQIKQENEEEEADEGERILLELGIADKSGQFAGQQVSEPYIPMPSIFDDKI